MDWRIATGIICCFGVFKDFRPSDSYITAYLIDPEFKNLTMEQVNNMVYPVLVYSYLATLVLVLLLTDFLRYKVVIIFEALSYISTWILLLWGRGLFLMQLMQFTFGCATSTEIAYYSYIYAAISKTHYRRASSFVRTSSLVGRFMAALLAQLLLSLAGVSFFVLNAISFANVCICFIVSLMLPGIRSSFYFEVEIEPETSTKPSKYCSQGEDEGNVMISNDSNEPTRVASKSFETENFSKDTEMEQLNVQVKDTSTTSCLIDPEDPLTVGEVKEGLDSGPGVLGENQSSSILSVGPPLDTTALPPTKSKNLNPLRRNSISHIKKSVYFLKKSRLKRNVFSSDNHSVTIQEGLRRMWNDFLSAYKDRKLLLWSVWWAFTTCGKVHLGNYIQSLYEVVRLDQNSATNYNAAVDATSLAICAAASFGIGFVKVDWSKYGELLLFFVNLVIGSLLVWMSFTNNIWIAYICYLFIRIIFQTVLTIATFQVAVHLSSRCYGLVFGLNTFLALLLETIMTVIVVDKNGLNLDVRTQFVVYGGYFGILSLPFLLKFLYNCFCKKNGIELAPTND